MKRLADALAGSPVRPRSLRPLLRAEMFSEEGEGQRLEEEPGEGGDAAAGAAAAAGEGGDAAAGAVATADGDSDEDEPGEAARAAQWLYRWRRLVRVLFRRRRLRRISCFFFFSDMAVRLTSCEKIDRPP